MPLDIQWFRQHADAVRDSERLRGRDPSKTVDEVKISARKS